jgi:molybdopterin biosynthesis enzyme MoaB
MSVTTDKKCAELQRLLQEAGVKRLVQEIVQDTVQAHIEQIGKQLRKAGFNL